MSYDTRAEIFALRTSVAADGSPSETWKLAGTVYLEAVRLSTRDVLTSGKEAIGTESAYNYRPHSEVKVGVKLRFNGSEVEVVRVEPRGRTRAGTLYVRGVAL